MYLQLAGHTPLHNAENPMAPGAPTYKYDNFYLGQSQAIILPDALFPPNVAGYANALKTLGALLQKIQDGKQQDPAAASGGIGSITIGTIIAFIKVAGPYISAASVAARGAFANLARQRITEMYNGNSYDVRNLNTMNAQTVGQKIAQIDRDLQNTRMLSIGKSMALARFRLVYQQKFDQVSGGGGFGNLPAWVLPAALGLGALLILRGRK